MGTIKSFLKKAAFMTAIAAAFTVNAQTVGAGIAAGFPGDVGIASHPDVILAENFEGYNVWRDLMGGGWGVTNGENPAPEGIHVHFSKEHKFTGTQSLQLDLYPRNTPRHTGINLDLDAVQQQNTIYVRYYHKIDKSYHVPPGVSNHNGASISSKYWTSGPAHMGPGKAATGTNKYLVQLENTASSGYDGYSMKAYIYHPEQRYNYEGFVPIPGMSSRDPGEPWTSAYTHRPGEQYGDAFYPDGEVMPWNHWRGDYGPEFVSLPKFFVEFDRWYCYELMLKANTPGQRDGRLTAWIDGEIIMDFPNMRLRDIEDLKIDQVGFTFGADRIPDKTSAWYDNIVIATSYIGPINFGDQPVVVPPPPDPEGSVRVRLAARESIGAATNPPFRSAPVTITGNGTYTATVYTMEYDSFTGLALESAAPVPAGWEGAAITFDKVTVSGVPAPGTKQGSVDLIDVPLGNTRGSVPLVGAGGSVNVQLWNGIQSPFQYHLSGIDTAMNRGHTGFAVPGISKITAVEVTFTVTGSTLAILSPDRVIPGSIDNGVGVIAPVVALPGEFTAGPNPAVKSSGAVNFFWQGKSIRPGTLTIYDASGNIVNKIRVNDGVNGNGNRRDAMHCVSTTIATTTATAMTTTTAMGGANATKSRRIIGTWNLTDRKGRPVPEGTYLVKGIITTLDGKKEKVSVAAVVR